MQNPQIELTIALKRVETLERQIEVLIQSQATAAANHQSQIEQLLKVIQDLRRKLYEQG
jgi:hypothetical protein